MPNSARIRIGISGWRYAGWRYAGWRGSFYPAKLAQRRELEYASHHFDTIELNGTHYSLQTPDSFARWNDETPGDFQFAIKGSRFITHMLKLRKIETPLANFFAQGLLRLGPKLGPILWQFPPRLKFDPHRFDEFFSALPRSTAAAAQIATHHDARLKHGSWTQTAADAELRHAVEIRDESFACDEFITLLRQHGIALVVADTVEWPLLMDLTADFVYCRLHGSKQLYTSGYGPKSLAQWAERVVAWSCGNESPHGRWASSKPGAKCASRDVYVYFDNDAKVRAPVDAANLRKIVNKSLAK